MGEDHLREIFPECLQAGSGSGVGEVPVLRTDPALQGLGIRAVCKHVGAVVALEHDTVAVPEQPEHGGGHDPGVGTIPDPAAVLADDITTRFCCIMGRGERLDTEIAQGETLAAPAGVVFDRLVRRPPVVQEVRKRTFRGIDRPAEAPEEDVKPPHMVAMFMGDQHCIDCPGIDAGGIHAPEEFLCAQAGIDEEGAAAPGDYHTVPFASARKHRAAHCLYYSSCSY